jgi:hypothetical protein
MAVGALMLLPWLLGPDPADTAARENRGMAPVPPMSAGSWSDTAFYAGMNAAVADRIRSKPLAVGLVNGAVLALTDRSASPDVVAGEPLPDRGHRLYYAGEFTESCPHARQPQWAEQGMQRLASAAAAGGKSVVFAVVPNKSTTQPLPSRPATDALLACASAADAALRRLAASPGSPVIQVEPDDVLAWDPQEPYWDGDTHWTPTGGMALVAALVQRLGGSSPDLAARFDMTSRTLRVREDLYGLLGLQREAESAWPQSIASQVEMTELTGATPYPILRFQSSAPIQGLPERVLIVFDSFVYVPRLQAALASSFRETWMVQWDGINDLEGIPPVDAVIFESTERLAGGRLSGFYEGGPLQPALDLLQGPADTP